MPGEPMAVIGLGAVSPVGLSAAATCAALRAGISRLKPIHTHAVDGPLFDKQPVVGGRVPLEWLEGEPPAEDWPGHDRFGLAHPPARDELVPSGLTRVTDLATLAAQEAWLDAGLDAWPAPAWGLYLAVGEHDDASAAGDALLGALGTAPPLLRFDAHGRAGALVALGQAIRDLGDGSIEVALVGGADSQIRAEVLKRLDEEEAIKSAVRPQAPNPGEAAAFLAVCRAKDASRHAANVRALVLGAGSAEEPTAGTDEPNRGEGLAAAIRGARTAAPPSSDRPLVICDLDGDRYRGLEWTIVQVRTFGDLRGEAAVWHPADSIGDAGGGLGSLNLVWAATALSRGYSGTDRVLVWGASTGRDRAAVILAGPKGKGH